MPYVTLTERLRRHLERLAQPRKPRGRPPLQRDYSKASADEITRRMAAIRSLQKRTDNVAVIKRWDEELRRLRKIRRHLKRKKRRRNKRQEAILKAAKQEAARIEREIKQAANQEAKKQELLAEWQQTEPRWDSHTASRLSEMRCGHIYRYRQSVGTFCKVPRALLKHYGLQEGDVRRERFHLKGGFVYQNGGWVAADNFAVKQTQIKQAQSKPSVTSTKPNPADSDLRLEAPKQTPVKPVESESVQPKKKSIMEMDDAEFKSVLDRWYQSERKKLEEQYGTKVN